MISSLPRIARIRRSLSSSRSSPTLTLCKSLSSSIPTTSPATPILSTTTPSSCCTDRQNRQSYQHYNFVTPPQSSNNQWSSRQFSSEGEGKEKKKDLRESIERLKNEGNNSSDESDKNNENTNSNSNDNNEHIEKLTTMGESFLDTLSQTWDDLIASGQAKDINKKIGTPTSGEEGDANYANDDEAADKYEEYKGSKDIMLIDPEEHLSAWERMERRLRDAPIISDILEHSNTAYEKSGAKSKVQKTTQKIQHLKEDAEEAWETSQNPWVYRASSVYDTLTAESEFATATKQLQTLDPDFTMENWKRDVVEHTLPQIMKCFLQGRIQELKPWLGEAVYNRLAAESRARKKEGVQMDTNILAIMNAEILACELAGSSVNVDRGDDPIILLHFMCQQIHCVRKKVTKENGADGESEKEKDEGDSQVDEGDSKVDETNSKKDGEEEDGSPSGSDSGSSRTYMEEELGDIVEGSEDDIRANSYVVAFQREYNEEKMELNWKIVDFRFNGAIAYL